MLKKIDQGSDCQLGDYDLRWRHQPGPRIHRADISGYRILYVEDDCEVAELCCCILAAIGYAIETAATGREGLDKFKKQPFDVVILDYGLPDTNGLEVARSLLKTSPDLPIVFVTAKGSEKIAAEALSIGVAQYIIKNSMDVYEKLLPEVLKFIINGIESKKNTEKQLREYQNATTEIYEHSPAAQLSVNVEDASILRHNHKLVELLGYTPEEIQTMTVVDFYTDDGNGIAKAEQILKSVRSGREIEGEATMRRKDGGAVWVQVSVSPVFNDTGELTETRSIITDISECKKAEEALALSEQNYRALLENAQDGIYLFDPETLEIVYLNTMGAKRLGYKREELIGETINIISKSSGGNKDRKRRFAEIIANNEPAIGQGIHVRKDGTEFPVETSYVGVERDGRKLIQAVARDITEHKKLEADLRNEHERLVQANQIAGLGFFERDLIADSWYWSAETYRIFGIEGKRPAISNNYFLQCVHPDDRETMAAAGAKPAVDPGPVQAEFRITCPDGSVRHIHTVQKLIRDGGGKPIKIMGTMRDITKRKSAEQSLKDAHDELDERVKERTKALHEEVVRRKRIEIGLIKANKSAVAANRAKSQFLANMSHELRTPLNAIIGFSSTMKDEIFGPLNDKQKEYAADIQNSGEHLLELINDVLDVSVIEAGKFELSYEDFDLGILIDNALNIVRPQAEEAAIRLTARIDDNLPLLSADRRRVKQVLINLLSNAVKFTLPNGAISVDVKYDQANSHVVTIADTGVGMDEQEMAVAMTEFGQVNHAASHPAEGTGLGLPLAIKLVEMRGGTLRLTSEKSVGTTVVIKFPPEPVEAAA